MLASCQPPARSLQQRASGRWKGPRRCGMMSLKSLMWKRLEIAGEKICGPASTLRLDRIPASSGLVRERTSVIPSGRGLSSAGVGRVRVDSGRGHLLRSCWPRVVLPRPRSFLVPFAILILGFGVGCREEAVDSRAPQAGRQMTSKDSGPTVRAEAVRLWQCGSPAQVRALVSQLDDPEPLVGGTAVSTLLQARRDWVVAALKESDDSKHSRERRWLEIEIVQQEGSRSGSETLWPVCQWAIGEEDPWMRSRAVAACLAAGEVDVSWAESVMSDSHWAVRVRFATALARYPRRSSAEAWLQQLEQDSHATVRRAARESIARLAKGS